jgi:hypothetical protein
VGFKLPRQIVLHQKIFVGAKRQNVLIIDICSSKTGQGRQRQKSACMLILRQVLTFGFKTLSFARVIITIITLDTRRHNTS